MTREDVPVFDRAFRRLVRVYHVDLGPDDLAELARTYFLVLEDGTIEEVLQAAKQCLGTCRRFPKPATWLQTLMQARPAPDPPSGEPTRSDVRTMSAEETAVFLEAERLHYEDAPCYCLHCQAAGVTALPIRFVPTVNRDGDEERAYCPLKRQVVIAGHWAHGAELQRWHAARDHCFKLAPTHVLAELRLKMAKVDFSKPIEKKETA